MKIGSFLCGMGAGMVAGAAVGMACKTSKTVMKTRVGRSIESMGNTIDHALEEWLHNIK